MKAIFLDRDGTLNRDHQYTYRVEELEIIAQVREGLKLLANAYSLFIVTNQSGINRGFFKMEDAEKFTKALQDELKKTGIHFKDVFICPHRPEENCHCRKPKPHFIQEAVRKYEIDLHHSWVIGDRGSDVELAHQAGCSSVLVLTGVNFNSISELKSYRANYISADLLEAAYFILAEQHLNKICPLPTLLAKIDSQRKTGKKIVSINGSFDLLHSGHQTILKEAKEQGDILVVALNSDSSIKKYKSEDRPINGELSRARRMAGFEDVDYVTVFNETDPIALLEQLKPNVHVNGSEYGENCIEAPTVKKHGGRIHIVKLVDGFSTSNLLKEKILNSDTQSN